MKKTITRMLCLMLSLASLLTVGAFAAEGAFAAINQAFAASDAAAPYPYINREEDMGMPGLRKAKEAYRPAFKVEKYYGTAE